jgi:hypothetical protein
MAKKVSNGAQSGGLYGLGLIGASVFFISEATGFWMGVVGFLKALVWPAFLVFEAQVLLRKLIIAAMYLIAI